MVGRPAPASDRLSLLVCSLLVCSSLVCFRSFVHARFTSLYLSLSPSPPLSLTLPSQVEADDPDDGILRVPLLVERFIALLAEARAPRPPPHFLSRV